MNIETKTINAYSALPYAGKKEEYLCFGWKHTEDTRVRVGRGHRTVHVLARDKDMPNYRLLVQLESEYFTLKRTKQVYKPMTFGIVLLTFVLFFIPGVIYVVVKSKQKKRIEEYNAGIQQRMNVVAAKAKALL